MLALLLQNGKGRLAQAKSSGDSAVTAAELDNTTRIAAAGSIEADVGESAQVDERVPWYNKPLTADPEETTMISCGDFLDDLVMVFS